MNMSVSSSQTPLGVKMLSITAVAPGGRRLGDQEDRRDQGVKAVMLSALRIWSRWRCSWRSRWGPGSVLGLVADAAEVGRASPEAAARSAIAVEVSQAKRQEQVQAKVTAAAEQAGPVAAPLRRGRAGQDPAQAAQRRLPAGASRRRLLRGQADRAPDRAGRRVSAGCHCTSG